PTLGGWITDNASWRWVFLVNVPVGVILALLAARVIVDSPAQIARRRERLARGLNLDYLGFALLVVGMCALQVVLDKGQEDDWLASAMITDLAITAAVALVAFVVWELYRTDPVVDLRLLKNRNFAVGNLLMFMLGFILLGSTVLVPLFVQSMLDYTATEAGLVISPGGFAIMLFMPLVGILIARMDARWLIAFGLVVTSLGLFDMTRFDLNVDYATVAWARIYQSIGLAFLFIPINTIAYLGLPPAKTNDASAIVNMMRNLGGSFGIAIATTVLVRRQQYHQSILVDHVTPYSSRYDAAIQAMQQPFLHHSASAPDILHQAQALLYATVQRQAAVMSYIDSFWLLGMLFLVLIPLVFLMKRPQPGG
ncbi:MAG: DHA2 family efflux MFS transporter permease subunit, partial [Acetobacteraceae bacterium]